MKKWDILYIIPIVVGIVIGMVFAGFVNGKMKSDELQADFENQLMSKGIIVTDVTLNHEPNIIIRLNSSAFLEQAKGEAVYRYANVRYFFFSSDWKIQYEYDTYTIWSLW